jgi:hypothetical protein
LNNIYGRLIKECIDDILYGDSTHLNDIEPEPDYYNYDNDNEQIMHDNNEGGQADHYDEGQVDHHDEGKADHGY